MRRDYAAQCSPLLREYLGYIETVKGRASHTVDEYFTDLRTFFRFIKVFRGLAGEQDEIISLLDVDIALVRSITLTDVYEYLNYAKNERGNNNKTLARKTTSLRMFFRYLTDTAHLLENNPLRSLDTPKAKRALPRYLTLEQSMELLGSVDGAFAQRDYCMLALLLNCGLRRAELAAIDLSDISTENTLRVHGKGNKERMVYLNDACQEAIREYRKVRPVDGVRDKNALFLNKNKERISLQGVHYIVKGYLTKIGLPDYSTHKLRHTAATLMYQKGNVDIRVLQEILGHENLGTTEIYTHLSDKQIREASESNPLSRVKPPKQKIASDKKDTP